MMEQELLTRPTIVLNSDTELESLALRVGGAITLKALDVLLLKEKSELLVRGRVYRCRSNGTTEFYYEIITK